MVSKKSFAIMLLLASVFLIFGATTIIVSGGQKEDSKSLTTGPSKVVVNDQMKPTTGEDLVDVGQYLPGSGVDLVKQTPEQFIRGDCNGSGAVEMMDASCILYYYALGSPVPSCMDAADANDNGLVEMMDASLVLYYYALGSPQPPSPFPACGVDPTADGLDCASYPPCGTKDH